MTLGGWGKCLGCDGLKEGVGAAVTGGPQGAELGAEAVKGNERRAAESLFRLGALQGCARSGGLYSCKRAPKGCVQGQLQLCTSAEGPLSARLQLPSSSGLLLPGAPPQALLSTNPTDVLGSGQTDGVPMSVPMEMGPAALCALLGV